MKTKVVNPVTGKMIDEGTYCDYARRGRQFLRQFSESKGIDPKDIPQYMLFLESFSGCDFCDWIIAKKENGAIAKSAWRQYKASACILLYELLSEGHKGVTNEDLKKMSSAGSDGAKHKGGKTSSKKKKGFTRAEQRAVEAYLLKAVQGDRTAGIPKLLYARELYDLIHGNLHVGLRPKEYSFAFLEGDELIVKNGKYSEDRAHGEQRTLQLQHLAPDVIDSIERTLDRFRSTYFDEWGTRCIEMAEALVDEENSVKKDLNKDETRKVIEAYAIQIMFLDAESLPEATLVAAHKELERISREPVAKLYKSLQDNMRRVTRRVFTMRTKSPLPTIYSTRHQVSADLKKANVTKEEIAAIMGHKITRTHQVHYARRSKGEVAAGLVQANAADVARVRDYSMERELRIQKNKMKLRNR